MKTQTRFGLLLSSALTITASLAALGASTTVSSDPSERSAAIEVQLGFWNGTVNLFPDRTAELDGGQSLGSWWIAQGEESATVHINMGAYGDGAHMSVEFFGDVIEGSTGISTVVLADGTSFAGPGTVVDLLDLVIQNPPDVCFRVTSKTEHPAGDTVTQICRRVRHGRSCWVVKTQRGKEYIIHITHENPGDGSGYYEADGKVLFAEWNGRV